MTLKFMNDYNNLLDVLKSWEVLIEMRGVTADNAFFKWLLDSEH